MSGRGRSNAAGSPFSARAGHEQREKRELRRLVLEHRREQVRFHVMHGERRDPESESHACCERAPDHERSDQSRAGRISDRLQIGHVEARLSQHVTNHRREPRGMVARSQLGDDATEGLVYLDLAEQRLRQQAAVRIVNGDAGFVAAGFDTEDVHDEPKSGNGRPVFGSARVAGATILNRKQGIRYPVCQDL